jgi:hypothetical protein
MEGFPHRTLFNWNAIWDTFAHVLLPMAHLDCTICSQFLKISTLIVFFKYTLHHNHTISCRQGKGQAQSKGKAGAARSKQSRGVIEQATLVYPKLTAKRKQEPLALTAKHKQRWQSREGGDARANNASHRQIMSVSHLPWRRRRRAMHAQQWQSRKGKECKLTAKWEHKPFAAMAKHKQQQQSRKGKAARAKNTICRDCKAQARRMRSNGKAARAKDSS